MQMNSPAVVIDGYENVPENDEAALLKAVTNQPVSVSIEASSKQFQFYSEVTSKSLLVIKQQDQSTTDHHWTTDWWSMNNYIISID